MESHMYTSCRHQNPMAIRLDNLDRLIESDHPDDSEKFSIIFERYL